MMNLVERTEDTWWLRRGSECIGSVVGHSIHLYRDNHSPAELRAIADLVEKNIEPKVKPCSYQQQ